jgi:hypothetical protein
MLKETNVEGRTYKLSCAHSRLCCGLAVHEGQH